MQFLCVLHFRPEYQANLFIIIFENFDKFVSMFVLLLDINSLYLSIFGLM